jgi:hypothetical protein
MAKSFYFFQTVSKQPNFADFAFLMAKWQPRTVYGLVKVDKFCAK